MKHKLSLLIAVLFAASALIGCSNSNNSLSTNADYTQYEAEQMAIHDGEVLVDSKAIKEEPTPEAINDNRSEATSSVIVSKTEAEKQAEKQSKKMSDATLVTSDNYEELQSSGAYYDEARSSINMDRNEIMAMLDEVIAAYGDHESPEKIQAQEQKLKIIDYMNKEKLAEDILKAKGYKKVFVLITDNSVNITIGKQDVSKSDIATIVDVVTRETGRSLDQIVIQSKL